MVDLIIVNKNLLFTRLWHIKKAMLDISLAKQMECGRLMFIGIIFEGKPTKWRIPQLSLVFLPYCQFRFCDSLIQ